MPTSLSQLPLRRSRADLGRVPAAELVASVSIGQLRVKRYFRLGLPPEQPTDDGAEQLALPSLAPGQPPEPDVVEARAFLNEELRSLGSRSAKRSARRRANMDQPALAALNDAAQQAAAPQPS